MDINHPKMSFFNLGDDFWFIDLKYKVIQYGGELNLFALGLSICGKQSIELSSSHPDQCTVVVWHNINDCFTSKQLAEEELARRSRSEKYEQFLKLKQELESDS